ncbi:MAG: hypothetical protein LIR50_22230 [Bacillota bacterium]|nr:hypothetical protein [Bacillota bacterium]
MSGDPGNGRWYLWANGQDFYVNTSGTGIKNLTVTGSCALPDHSTVTFGGTTLESIEMSILNYDDWLERIYVY